MDTDIQLTQTVQKGGCAAKLPAGALRQTLTRLNLKRPAQLLVGTEHFDDAAVWDLQNGYCLLQTLDFFTPIVDEPFAFGQIAAANALSDVYAMGGEPQTCLSILAFPTAHLPMTVLEEVLRGAVDRIDAAGSCLAGGHTIDDDTLKFGLSVSGLVERARLWTNQGARPGDVLILTKALGTGTITSALKRRESSEAHVQAAIASMIQLNQVPSLVRDLSIHAATDITGFGLAGHALQMSRASQVQLHIELQRLPILPGALEYLEKRVLNKAHRTNQEYVQAETDYASSSEVLRLLTVDPQTSGGLLLSVKASDADEVLRRLKPTFFAADVIGTVTSFASGSGNEGAGGSAVQFTG